MKISCNVMSDILPLYVEEMASSDTRKLVEEHLASCDHCRQLLDEMKLPEKLPMDADVAPLKNIQTKLRRKRMLTIIFSVMLTLVMAIVAVSYLTAPEYLPYSEDIVTVTEKEDGTVILEFGEGVYALDFNAYPADRTSGYVYHITTWDSIWNRTFSKHYLTNTVLNPNGEKVDAIYYYKTDGTDDVLIYGEDPTSGGFIITLPRLVLANYALFVIVFSVICWVGLVIFRKNERIRNILEKVILLPMAYIIATFLIEGIDTTTYSASRDFYAILLVTIPLYFAMVLGIHLIRNYKTRKKHI